jgi:hypothetical protein
VSFDQSEGKSLDMKQYPLKFELSRNGIEWYQTEKTLGSDRYFHYFKIFKFTEEDRKNLKEFGDDKHFKIIFGNSVFGLMKFWHDCPHVVLNLYFITICWSTQWTRLPKNYWR